LIEYPQHSILSREYVKEKIAQFLIEDMPNGDVTTNSTIPDSAAAVAEIQAAAEMVFAGAEVVPYCFDKNCKVEMKAVDGVDLISNSVIGVISGKAKSILSGERVMLNLIQRLCGIASLTREYVNLADPYKVKILDTRKTTPGLRLFEKYAVNIGGACNHRLNLSAGILIKDNHILAAGSVTNAIKMAREGNSSLPLELEVDNFEQIEEALTIGVDGFLLDNMPPEKISTAVKLIRKQDSEGSIFIEASGGINLSNIRGYLDTGINAISIGALTHSAVGKDIRLELIQ